MKILQINTFYKHGSTGRIVSDLQGFCQQNNIECYVAYGCKTSDNINKNSICLQGYWRRKWNILKTRLFGRHGFYNIEETNKLIEYINQIKPDVIHLHNIHNHYINIELLFDYIKKQNYPIIWTLHDCWPFTGWCAYFDYVACNKWKSYCYNCPSLKDYPRTWFFDRSYDNYYRKKKIFIGVRKMTLVTPSNWLASLIQSSFLKEYPINVINNGVDLDLFRPIKTNIKNKLGIEDKNVLLAIVPNLAKRKGAGDLLKIPHLLKNNEILLLIGLTPKQIKQLPKNNCIGIAYTENINDLVAIYSAVDVFINPTYEDNFPTTNIEALACGTPVVTYNTGGSIEVVDELTGYVVQKGNINEMLKASRSIIEKGKDFYQQNCRNKALLCYEKNKQYMKYIQIYLNSLKE